jgi:hypothetical protein
MTTVKDVFNNLEVFTKISEHFHKNNDKAKRWVHTPRTEYRTTIFNNRVVVSIPLEFGTFCFVVRFSNTHRYVSNITGFDLSVVEHIEVSDIRFEYCTPYVGSRFIMTTGKVSRSLNLALSKGNQSLEKQLDALANKFLKVYDSCVMSSNNYTDGVHIPYLYQCNRIANQFEGLDMLLSMLKHNEIYKDYDKSGITRLMDELRSELRYMQESNIPSTQGYQSDTINSAI